MKKPRPINCIHFFLLLVMLPFFAGCFELLEEIWINADGSGRMKVDIAVSEEILSMGEGEEENPFADLDQEFLKTKEELERNPGVTRVGFRHYSDGGVRHFLFDIEVTDVADLGELPRIIYAENGTSNKPTDNMFPLQESELLIERQDNRNILFVRRFGEPSEGDSLDEQDEVWAGAMFGNYQYTVRLHAEDIESANGRVDEAGTTVEWKVPIGLLMTQKKFQREFRAEIGGSDGNDLTLIMAVLLMAGIVGGVFVLMRKRKTSEPQSTW